MLKFSIFGFPVRVHPWFWVICFLFSGGLGMSGELGWVPVLESMTAIFVSILIHELGHALATRLFGGFAEIEIHSLGGTTFLLQRHYSRPQRIIINAAGPFFGFCLAGICFVMIIFSSPPFLQGLAQKCLFINLVWNVFNLLPIMPMDGGQILRDILGAKYFRLSCIIGMLTAIVCGIVAFYYGFYVATVLLGFFAVANFRGTLLSGGVKG